MTGISDVYRNATQAYQRSKAWLAPLLPYLPDKMRKFLLKQVNIGFVKNAEAPNLLGGVLNDFRPSLSLNPQYDPSHPLVSESNEGSGAPTIKCAKSSQTELGATLSMAPLSQDVASFSWGLLLPVCSRGARVEDCLMQLGRFRDSLFQTTRPNEDCSNLKIVLGVDCGDPVYDSSETLGELRKMLAPYSIEVVRFPSGFGGRICWIWEHLARVAVYKCAVDFFVLLGDDVELKTEGWMCEIEREFLRISQQLELPFGIACVAFRDSAFPVFPTFPVLHRRHLEALAGRLFEDVFVNQHGDPFLFEIYRRWGASKFAERAELRNTVGGAHDTARYMKCDTAIPWRDRPLTNAIHAVENWLRCHYPGRGFSRYVCIDVVCPTYRCDPQILNGIASLCASPEARASVQTLFVIDNPKASVKMLERSLQRYTENRLVRVYKNPQNLGASASRNAGMAQSFADYVICLDDDVTPEPHLLDAYIGAVQRHPDAQAWIGSTTLPKCPQTLMQHALIACGITFFYNVADRMPNPPWGVTANICFRGRTQNDVWFSNVYPKTGGGEDIDYCLRLKGNAFGAARDHCFVAVPGARAEHPFWPNILRQISGWASGDVLCLETQPHNTFYTFPNWVETIFFIFVYALYQSIFSESPQGDNTYATISLQRRLSLLVTASVTILMLEAVLSAASFTLGRGKELSEESLLKQWAVILLSVFPGFVQDCVRLHSKISRLKFYQVCLNFDWMDGQADHSVVSTWNECYKFVLRVILLRRVCADDPPDPSWAQVFETSLGVFMFIFWCFSRQRDFFYMPPAAEIFPLIGQDSESEKYDQPQMQPFIVLGFQRTGSNLLCGILHNHPNVAMHNEIFHAQYIRTYYPRDDWPQDFNEEVREKDPARFLRAVFCSLPASKKDAHASGFKLLPEHFRGDRRNECLLKLLQDKRVKKIILHREDAVAVQVSMMRAALSGHFVGKVLDGILVKIPVPALQRFVLDYKKTYEFYDKITSASGQSVFRLSYEQLATDQHTVVEALIHFLGVGNDHVPAALKETVRQSQCALPQGVCNYQEIELAFRYEENALFSERAATSEAMAAHPSRHVENCKPVR